VAAKLTGPDIAKGLANMSRQVQAKSLDTLKASAEAGQKLHAAIIRKDSGGDSQLSGVNAAKGKTGNTKVGVRFKLEKRGTSPSGVLTATGPLQLINNDTAGRVIRSAYLYGGRGNARKGMIGPVLAGTFTARRGSFIGPVLSNKAVLRLPDGGFRQSVRHPGTSGKQTWQRGTKVARPVISQSMSKRTTNVLKGVAKL
jgi:hypothetical protein